jgi:hypothetical protein
MVKRPMLIGREDSFFVLDGNGNHRHIQIRLLTKLLLHMFIIIR